MQQFVTALKSYGQHFLNDKVVLQHILDIIKIYHNNEKIVEIGPGMGALTTYLIKEFPELTCVEVDKRCIDFLNTKYKTHEPDVHLTIVDADFLKLNLKEWIQSPTAIVGNFPYNISSQIIFRIIDNFEMIPFMVGMFQKEMAVRIASKHGSKEYGVISVLTQLYYDVKVEFDILPSSFSPPPKVMSSVISLKRKENIAIDFDVVLFKKIVKAGFAQRRKMLRNGLSGMLDKEFLQQELFSKRAEQLSLQDFIDLTKMVEKNK